MTDSKQPPPPQRDYRQMVRIVREDASGPGASTHRLGEAYGAAAPTPTATRERSLDELGIDARTSRRPEPPATDNILPQRSATALYHQLGAAQQACLDGNPAATSSPRAALWPGTRERAWLDSEQPAQEVTPTPPERGSAGAGPESAARPPAGAGTPAHPPPQHVPVPLPPPPEVKKQTRLPLAGAAPLDGIQGSSVDFDLRVHKPVKPG